MSTARQFQRPVAAPQRPARWEDPWSQRQLDLGYDPQTGQRLIDGTGQSIVGARIIDHMLEGMRPGSGPDTRTLYDQNLNDALALHTGSQSVYDDPSLGEHDYVGANYGRLYDGSINRRPSPAGAKAKGVPAPIPPTPAQIDRQVQMAKAQAAQQLDHQKRLAAFRASPNSGGIMQVNDQSFRVPGGPAGKPQTAASFGQSPANISYDANSDPYAGDPRNSQDVGPGESPEQFLNRPSARGPRMVTPPVPNTSARSSAQIIPDWQNVGMP